MGNASIYVATHKKTDLSLPSIYKICQVNAEKNGAWDGEFVHDNDSADNISCKNDRYCELTALYELWKNDQSEIKGLVHYRRYFSARNKLSLERYINRFVKPENLYHQILSADQIERYLQDCDMIAEFPRNPYLVNAREDLLRFVFPKDIMIMDSVIGKYFPDYQESYDTVMRAANITYLNMYVAKAAVSDAYCQWLFSVLEKVEEKLEGIEEYDPQHKRIFGYLAEVLLNVWILKNKIRVKHAFVLQFAEDTKTNVQIAATHFKRPSRFFTGYATRYRQLKRAAAHPYSTSLDDIYRHADSLESVMRYYRRFPRTQVSRETMTIDGKTLEYAVARVWYRPAYTYAQSNARCLVTLFTDDTDGIHAFMEQVSRQYRDQYTVTFRLVTRNTDLQQYARDCPNVYVFVRGTDR